MLGKKCGEPSRPAALRRDEIEQVAQDRGDAEEPVACDCDRDVPRRVFVGPTSSARSAMNPR